MKPISLITLALAASLASCGGSPAAPTGQTAAVTPPVAAFTGTWSGTGNDSQGLTSVTWTLTQTGDSVSGTVKTQAVDPSDGSCNSCHRNKSGTVSGTISGSSVSLRLFFAAGIDGDPTPICSQTLDSTVSSAGDGRLSGTYSGADTCEGPLTSGALALDRRQ
jgi:hypothetical protein